MASAQLEGGVAAYIDAEHAMDPDYAIKLGVNIEDMLISQPDSGEQALEIAETLKRQTQKTENSNAEPPPPGAGDGMMMKSRKKPANVNNK